MESQGLIYEGLLRDVKRAVEVLLGRTLASPVGGTSFELVFGAITSHSLDSSAKWHMTHVQALEACTESRAVRQAPLQSPRGT